MDITRNSILRINDKKTLQLVQEIKKDDCLWNTTLDDYPNRAKRAKAAERIARALNVPNFEARHVLMKLKNLRNSYCQELKKIGHSIERTGSEDSPDNYRPKVQWFAIMDSFMRPHLQSKNVMLVNQRRYEDAAVRVKRECEDSNQSVQEDWSLQHSEAAAPETSYSYDVSCDNDEADSQLSKRRRLSQSCDQADNIDTTNNVEQPYPNLSKVTNDVLTGVTHLPRQEDLFDNFGKYIASLLRCLPEDQALRLQPEIVNMIIQVRMKDALKVENSQNLEKIDSSSALDSD